MKLDGRTQERDLRNIDPQQIPRVIKAVEDEKDKGFAKPKDKLWTLLSRQHSFRFL